MNALRRLVLLAASSLFLIAAAGDPVPGVDVSLEQKPGGNIVVTCHKDCRFDEVRLDVSRDWARALEAGPLPPGFTLSQEGRRVVIQGEPSGPVRFRIPVGQDVKPAKLDFEVRRGGQTLLSRKGVLPPITTPPVPLGSLQGVVQLPPQVSPGELIQFEPLDPAKVPPGGRWTLAGQVVEPDRPPRDSIGLTLPATPGQDPAQRDTVARCLAAALAEGDTAVWKNYESVKSNTAGIALNPVDTRSLPAATEGVVVRCSMTPGGSAEAMGAINTSRSNIKQMLTAKGASPAGVFTLAGSGGKPETVLVLIQEAGKDGRRYRVSPVPKTPPANEAGTRSFRDEGVEVAPGVAVRGDRIDYTFRVTPPGGTGRGEPVVLTLPGKPGESAVWRQSVSACLSAALVESQSAVWKNYNNVKSNTAGIVATPTGFDSLGDGEVVAVTCQISKKDCSGDEPRLEGAINTSRSNIKQAMSASQQPRVYTLSTPDGRTTEVFAVTLDTGNSSGGGGSRSRGRQYQIASGEGDSYGIKEEGVHFTFTVEPADLPAPRPGTVITRLPTDLRPGQPLSLVYTDVFGDRLVDVPRVEGVEVVPEPPRTPKPRITAVTPQVFAGDVACVCGSFPDRPSWHGLRFDRDALGAPLSASSRTVWVRVPASVAIGKHMVAGDAAAGYGPTDQAATEVIQINGEIDANLLMRGQSTPMRLQIQGTDRPVELRLRNLTPSIISIEGGEDQVVRTSGGNPNAVQRTVRGLTRGDFNVDYTLATPPCPCAAARAAGR